MLAYGDARKYGGNEGYSDSTDFYSFDSRVANWRQVSAGDLALVAGRRKRAGPPELNGIATVARLTSSGDLKVVRSCPVCGHPRFSDRVTMTPRWRCDHGHEFDTPAEELVEVTRVVAHFDGSYRPAAGAMTAAELKAAQTHKLNTNAIRPLDVDAVRRLFSWDRDLQRVLSPGSYADPEEAANVDQAAIPMAQSLIEARYPGAHVEPQDHGNPGFDFLVQANDAVVRYVELKSTRNPYISFYMSEYQRVFSKQNAGRYTLLVLTTLDLMAGTCTPHWFDGAVEDHFALGAIEWRVSLKP
jgi:hypothetical protein